MQPTQALAPERASVNQRYLLLLIILFILTRRLLLSMSLNPKEDGYNTLSFLDHGHPPSGQLQVDGRWKTIHNSFALQSLAIPNVNTLPPPLAPSKPSRWNVKNLRRRSLQAEVLSASAYPKHPPPTLHFAPDELRYHPRSNTLEKVARSFRAVASAEKSATEFERARSRIGIVRVGAEGGRGNRRLPGWSSRASQISLAEGR